MYASGEPPNVLFTEFTILVDDEMIYDGIIYPDLVAAPSPVPFFIASTTYPNIESSIIQIKHLGFFTETEDVRNDQRIIHSLNKSSLINHGLTSIIDSVHYSQLDDSTLVCSVTITNHDHINYYIPDPLKMGQGHFNYYTGGLRLIHKVSNEYFYPDYGDATTDWNYLELDDLSIIEGQSEVSFTFESCYDISIDEGSYECWLWYGNLRHLYTFNLELNQPDGRIWVGEFESSNDFTFLKGN